ncbi:hypothetical protein B0H13DRAFT_1625224 [Mycena leptocephala]|nr:hypothetical protein B0H13DRAFT_1625224 [Mycena leptocephala]
MPLAARDAARACSVWSRSLHAFASTLQYNDGHSHHLESGLDVNHVPPAEEELPVPGREAHVVLEDPYGGPTLRATDYETVLLFAGGSCATLTLGVLDEIVGCCVRRGHMDSEKTRRIKWCWCVRSFGAIN